MDEDFGIDKCCNSKCSKELNRFSPKEAIGINFCFEEGNKTTKKDCYCSQDCAFAKKTEWRCIVCQKHIMTEVNKTGKMVPMIQTTHKETGMKTFLVACSIPCQQRIETFIMNH